MRRKGTGMATDFPTSGSKHLARKSELGRTRQQLDAYRDILVIEDDNTDAERLTAKLHVLFGYDTGIRCAGDLEQAIACIEEQEPHLIFLDDILKPSLTALQAIPQLRSAGYKGPIIVVSGLVTHSRRSCLLANGASDAIHKDDIDSVRLAEAVSSLS